jgi:hypothetical protein
MWQVYAPNSKRINSWGDLSSAPQALKAVAEQLASNYQQAATEVLPGRTKLYRNFWSIPLSRMRFVRAALDLLPYSLRGVWKSEKIELELISLFVKYNAYETAIRSANRLPDETTVQLGQE